MTTPRPAFASVESWAAAAELTTFALHMPLDTGGTPLDGLRVFVRDHRGREVPPERRTIEAHYATFSFTQSLHPLEEAARWVFEKSYGRTWLPVTVSGVPGRAYPRGPEPEPDDTDGQSPAVVVWHDGPVVFFLASLTLPPERLVSIGASLVHAFD